VARERLPEVRPLLRVEVQPQEAAPAREERVRAAAGRWARAVLQ